MFEQAFKNIDPVLWKDTGEVKNDVKEDKEWDALYRDLKWLTVLPKKGEPLKTLSAAQIKAVMGFNFWWARTMKPLFLNKEESAKLPRSLKSVSA